MTREAAAYKEKLQEATLGQAEAARVAGNLTVERNLLKEAKSHVATLESRSVCRYVMVLLMCMHCYEPVLAHVSQLVEYSLVSGSKSSCRSAGHQSVIAMSCCCLEHAAVSRQKWSCAPQMAAVAAACIQVNAPELRCHWQLCSIPVSASLPETQDHVFGSRARLHGVTLS